MRPSSKYAQSTVSSNSASEDFFVGLNDEFGSGTAILADTTPPPSLTFFKALSYLIYPLQALAFLASLLVVLLFPHHLLLLCSPSPILCKLSFNETTVVLLTW